MVLWQSVMFVRVNATVLFVEEQGCSRSTRIHRLRMFEPQVMEDRNAMPAMEQESAASVTERGGCKSNLTNFRDQKGHAENKMFDS